MFKRAIITSFLSVGLIGYMGYNMKVKTRVVNYKSTLKCSIDSLVENGWMNGHHLMDLLHPNCQPYVLSVMVDQQKEDVRVRLIQP